MILGVLSAIALGIGITATAQDLINEDATARQEPDTGVEEIRQDDGKNGDEWLR